MTPTSATGPRAARAGLTLVELMIVLVILGMAGAAVVMTLPPTGANLDREAEVLAARLTRAREEAILSNRTIEAVVDAEGYAFRIRRPGRRDPLETPPFEAVRWPEGVAAAEEATFVFDPTGAAEPAELALRQENERAFIAVDSAGEVEVHAG